MAQKRKALLLVGGGHAHVAVLADWITNGQPNARASLLTPSRYLRYSGMVPGWIAGQYSRDEGVVDLGALAKKAGVQLLLGECTGIDPQAGRVKTFGGQALEYDVASFDTGGISRAPELLNYKLLGRDARIIEVRPIHRFVDRLEERRDAGRIAVVGGGAGGVEIAFALRNRAGSRAAPQVTLVCGAQGLVPNLAPAVRRKVEAELARQGITIIARDARIEERAFYAGANAIEPLDLIVTALGSAAPDWPGAGGLATDPEGFIAVDEHQRSTSHPNVFATGDIASRQDRVVDHSGVHAVMAGPHLAQNLRDMIEGRAPRAIYKPRRSSLYLLSTGDGGAILSYGRFAAQGRWVAKLKAAIDKRWISQYASLSI